MISVIIVDDEEDARKNVRRHLKVYNSEIEILAEADSADKAEVLIKELDPDIVFLDIAMPRRSGFDLLSSIPEFEGQVIFVTAFNKYAEEAFKFLAMGYLVKPLDKDEFSHTVDKTIEIVKLKKDKVDYNHLLELLKNENTNATRLIIPTDRGIKIIKNEEVLYLEGERNYTKVITRNSEFLSTKNLAKIESWLPKETFMRVHKSYIVNLTAVLELDNDGNVFLENEHRVVVSRRNKSEFIERLSRL